LGIKIKSKYFLFGGIIAAIFFWFAESFIHAYVFHMNRLSQELFPLSDPHELWMRILIVISFIIFGTIAQRMIDNLNLEKTRAEKAIEELQKALDEIRTLQGILPICASCKKIRDDKGYWNQIESYISKHSQAVFSHGLCPDCAEKVFEEVAELKKKMGKEKRF